MSKKKKINRSGKVGIDRNKTAEEFEAMLRGHFANRDVFTRPCSGFDLNTGVAWMEDILRGSERKSYEEHLAICPSCRQFTLELSKLNGELSLSPAPVPGILDRLFHYKLVVAEWVSLPDPASLFRHPAFGGAILSVCIIAAGALMMYQPEKVIPDQTESMVLVENANGEVVPSSVLPAVPENSDQAVGEQSLLNGSSVPRPDVAVTFIRPDSQPLVNNKPLNLPQIVSTTTFRMESASSQPYVVLPVARNIPNIDLELDAPPPTEKKVYLASLSDDRAQKKDGLLAKSVQKLSIVPNLLDNMWGYVQPNGPSMGGGTMRSSFMPVSADKELKFSSKKLNEPKDEDRPLIKKLFGKTFKYMNDGWMDQEFDYENMGWRGVIKLRADTDEYRRILSEEPGLKEFFQLGKVTVVWNDKIYKVVR